MTTAYQIIGLFAAGLIIFVTYRAIKNRPDLFQGANLNKSFFTMGILACVLIAFIAVLVLILNNS